MDRAGSPPPNRIFQLRADAMPPPAPRRGQVQLQLQEWRRAEMDRVEPPGTPERRPNTIQAQSPTTPPAR